jgi:hypothetical protein
MVRAAAAVLQGSNTTDVKPTTPFVPGPDTDTTAGRSAGQANMGGLMK